MTRWCLGALLLASGAVHAQTAPDDPVVQAKQLYADGKRFYDIGDYTQAIASWKHAYVLSNAPMLLFNIAQAYRLSGDCAEALKMYANYERVDPELPNREDLEQAKQRCDREPTRTNPPEPEPPSATAPVTTAPAPITTAPAPAPVQRRDDGRTLRIAGLATAGAGVVLAGASLYFAHEASTEASYVTAHRGAWTAADQVHEDSGKHAQTLAITTAIAAPLALATGAYLYYRGRQRSHVEVAVSRTHTEVSWSVSF
jgi:tetratricopeptide (TPR) repeat protein